MATATHNPQSFKSAEEKKAYDGLDKAKELGNQGLDKAKELGNQGIEKAKDVGSQVVEKAKEAVSSIGTMASDSAAAVGQKADDLTASAGSEIKGWGDSLRQNSSHEGLVGHASQAVADTLHDSGHYLEEAKLSGVTDDVNKLIHRNPLSSVVIALGIGFIVGRAMRS